MAIRSAEPLPAKQHGNRCSFAGLPDKPRWLENGSVGLSGRLTRLLVGLGSRPHQTHAWGPQRGPLIESTGHGRRKSCFPSVSHVEQWDGSDGTAYIGPSVRAIPSLARPRCDRAIPSEPSEPLFSLRSFAISRGDAPGVTIAFTPMSSLRKDLRQLPRRGCLRI